MSRCGVQDSKIGIDQSSNEFGSTALHLAVYLGPRKLEDS